MFARWHAIFPLAALLLGSGAPAHARAAPQHLRPAACESCHLAGAGTAPDHAPALTASQEQLCGQCHPDSLQLGHPSGFVPSPGQKVAPAYPLDRQGSFTCSTCHEIHGGPHGKLRGTMRGREMCMACHDREFFERMADGGASLMPYGHLGVPDTRHWQGLDRYSIRCMECHADRGDQNHGEDPIVLASNQILRHGSLNHSIGHNYAEAATFGGYRDIGSLSKKILLPNGMVSCVSCHQAYSKSHGELVTTLARSSLCFECHEL